MRATKILAIVGIVAALGGVMSLIHIQQVNAFLLGQGPPSNFPHSPLDTLRGDLGALRGDLGRAHSPLGYPSPFEIEFPPLPPLEDHP